MVSMRLHRLVPLVLLACTVLALAGVSARAQTTARLEAEKLFIEAQKALARGDSEAAESLLMQSLKKDSGFSSAVWQLAQIYESRGQLANARELILRGLTLEPDASWAREKLAQLEKTLTHRLLAEAEDFMGAGKYDLAIPKLSLYLGIKPYDPVPLIRLGRCHLALGNLDTAKEYLVQAYERDPTDGQVKALLAEIEERIGEGSVQAPVARAQEILAGYAPDREAEARAALRDILAKRPDHPWALEKLHELDLLAARRERALADADARPAGDGTRSAKAVARSGNAPDPAAAAGSSVERARRIGIDALTPLLLAVVVALLLFDIKRRITRRTYPLQGSLSLVPILDVVSLLNANLKTGRLIVTSDKSRGEIFFERGEIVHARWKDLDGKRAFRALMGRSSGHYFFNNRLPKMRQTISEPLSLLLLSMKAMDESERERSEPREKRQPVTTAF